MPGSDRWTDRGPLEERGGQCHASGLAEAMERTGFTAVQLAEATGYSPAIIGNLLRGDMVHRMAVSRIASVLGVDPAEIRGEVDSQSSHQDEDQDDQEERNR